VKAAENISVRSVCRNIREIGAVRIAEARDVWKLNNANCAENLQWKIIAKIAKKI
jgi:hypothetical protein